MQIHGVISLRFFLLFLSTLRPAFTSHKFPNIWSILNSSDLISIQAGDSESEDVLCLKNDSPTFPDSGALPRVVRSCAACDRPLSSRDAIVILGQKKHSSYDHTHSTSLSPILLSLDHYYQYVSEADVIVWHEGDLGRDDLPLNITFTIILCNLKLLGSNAWGLPKGTSDLAMRKIKSDYNGFSMGYRYMIRWCEQIMILFSSCLDSHSTGTRLPFGRNSRKWATCGWPASMTIR